MIDYDCPNCGTIYTSAAAIVKNGGRAKSDNGALTFVCPCGQAIPELELWRTIDKHYAAFTPLNRIS